MNLDARILLIGDELLAGELADANGPFLARELTAAGFRVRGIEVLGDDLEAITTGLRTAATAGLVVACGGLGPTSDDKTTAAVAAAFACELKLHEPQWQRIQQMFLAMRGVPPPPGNEKQATIPVGAEPLANAHGTALGYALERSGGWLAVLPGPPKENRPMFYDQLLPLLARVFPVRKPWRTQVFRVFGLAESVVAERLAGVEAQLHQVGLAYQFHFPEILVKLRVPPGADAEAAAAAEAVRAALAPYLYGEGDTTLAAELVAALNERGMRLVTAESCTGGLVGAMLVDVAGASRVYDRGFVTYSNQAKREVLHVPQALLEREGAVSEAVVLAMLEGALERSDADVGLAISGISGPGGGSAEKPVGTTWIAWGDRRHLNADVYRFRWDRDYNRKIAAWTALAKVLQLVRAS